MSSITLKRIQTEYSMLLSDPPERFVAYPMNDDLFNWHFTISGAEETEFENGIYHGVIKLPTNYPMKPPSIMFLTPNGRFDINMDVCLSVTKYHKEDWQPAWTIRTILEAIIAFFPVKEDHSAIGAIDYPIEIRKKLAVASQKWSCEKCGSISNQLKKKEKPKAEPIEEQENKQVISQEVPENKQENLDSKSQKSREDSNSDHSSKKNENDFIRKKIKKFDKKSDIDRRSFNIEAAIIEENINEEDEYEEEQKKNDKIEESINLLLQESIDQSRNDERIKKERIQNSREIYQPISSTEPNNQQTNNSTYNLNEQVNKDSSEQFNDFLKNLRIQQFEKSNNHDQNSKSKNSKNSDEQIEKKKFFEEESKIIEEEKILEEKNEYKSVDQKHGKIEHELLKQKGVNKNIFFTYKENPDIENMIKNYEIVKKVISEDIKNTSKQELEFYETSKSLKFHRSNSTEEIIKDIKSTGTDMNPLKVLENLTKSRSAQLDNNNSDNILNDESNQKVLIEFLNQLQYLKQQKLNFEELFAKKNLEVKIITKKSYESAMNLRMMITNGLIILSVAAVFVIYYYLRNRY